MFSYCDVILNGYISVTGTTSDATSAANGKASSLAATMLLDYGGAEHGMRETFDQTTTST